MGRIAILADTVADQIAAGEVVERPASVVKELVENALDAGASEILVELEGGGRTRLCVTDDGTGMDRDDAVLALDRHATSKIRQASDLIGVATYGFRGEALPAIASVAVVEIQTAPGGDQEATRLVVRGGRLDLVEPTARQRGTTVTVERLFYNTPARRKFLRSARAETRATSQALAVLALARLDVGFRLESDGRRLVEAPRVSSTAERVGALFGGSLAEQLLAVDWHAGALSVRGYIQRPADAQPSGRKAFLFVNGRPFRDPFLVRAAEAGYTGAIAPGSRPTILLSLQLPGDAVDVNVHPAKLEVRFRDRYLVERTVEDAVRAALGGMPSSAMLGPEGGEAGGGYGSFPPDRGFGGASAEQIESLFGEEGEAAGVDAPVANRLLQVFDTFILMETPDAIAIIDQHSAHERILYERAMAELSGKGAAAQRLLMPLTVQLEPEECDAVEAHSALLSAVGFEAEPFGGQAVAVYAVPNPHRRFDAQRCFQEVIADLAGDRFGGMHNRLERFAATYACRAAVKAGDHLEPMELQELVRRLFACELPPHDVHGRPTIVQLRRTELERRFGRG
ncbi:MAG TPA: DNA mismatch repair endonuclease MutL [Gemmatimonadales bacterium]